MDILIQGITSPQLDIRKIFGFLEKGKEALFLFADKTKMLASQNKQVNFGKVPLSFRAVSFSKKAMVLKTMLLEKSRSAVRFTNEKASLKNFNQHSKDLIRRCDYVRFSVFEQQIMKQSECTESVILAVLSAALAVELFLFKGKTMI